MKVLADENVDRQVVDLLRARGHEVTYIAELEPAADDPDILERANRTESLLITADKDFGELVYRMKKASRGIILIRLQGIPPDEKASIVESVVAEHSTELMDAFTVVTRDLVRIRRMK